MGGFGGIAGGEGGMDTRVVVGKEDEVYAWEVVQVYSWVGAACARHLCISVSVHRISCEKGLFGAVNGGKSLRQDRDVRGRLREGSSRRGLSILVSFLPKEWDDWSLVELRYIPDPSSPSRLPTLCDSR